MKKRLFVGSLPYNIDESQLRELFAKAGSIESCNVITDRMTGQSKGFAFVEYASEKDASKAIEMFKDYRIEDRKIAVSFAKPREESRSKSYGSNHSYRARRR